MYTLEDIFYEIKTSNETVSEYRLTLEKMIGTLEIEYVKNNTVLKNISIKDVVKLNLFYKWLRKKTSSKIIILDPCTIKGNIPKKLIKTITENYYKVFFFCYKCNKKDIILKNTTNTKKIITQCNACGICKEIIL